MFTASPPCTLSSKQIAIISYNMKHKKLILLALAFAAGALIKSVLSSQARSKKSALLREKARKRKMQILVSLSSSAGLPAISPSLSSKILHSSIPELQLSLSSGEITCKDIFLSYVHSLRTTSQQYNCISDLNLSYGLRRAEKLDLELQSGHKRSPLHGVPLSVKDSISVKGLAVSYGCAAESHTIAEADEYIVKVLKKKGVLIFVKGAVPQNMGSLETVNHVTGVALSPVDVNRSAGGSTGGDAALVASFGTCVALGSDLFCSARFRLRTSRC
jgi:hypothetical protein